MSPRIHFDHPIWVLRTLITCHKTLNSSISRAEAGLCTATRYDFAHFFPSVLTVCCPQQLSVLDPQCDVENVPED